LCLACSAEPDSQFGKLGSMVDPNDPNANTPTEPANSPAQPTGTAPGASVPAPAPQAGACPSYALAADNTQLIPAHESNGYTFTSSLSFQPITVAPDTNLMFDWSALTVDFMGHAITPADIDMVMVVLWELTPEQLAERMNDDSLAQRDTEDFATLYTTETQTSAQLLEMTLLGMPLTPEEIMPNFSIAEYDPALFTYTLMAQSGTEPGQGTRMIKVFKLDAATTNATVALDNTSTTLTYAADLHSLTPTYVPAGTPALTIDWSTIATNAMGRTFSRTKINEVFIARYDETAAELEARFLDLELISEAQWRGEVVAGANLPLSNLVDANNVPFPGIDANGTWVLGLLCNDCSNPAPWYLTVLEPCGSQ
jgi:hypothetical protein